MYNKEQLKKIFSRNIFRKKTSDRVSGCSGDCGCDGNCGDACKCKTNTSSIADTYEELCDMSREHTCTVATPSNSLTDTRTKPKHLSADFEPEDFSNLRLLPAINDLNPKIRYIPVDIICTAELFNELCNINELRKTSEFGLHYVDGMCVVGQFTSIEIDPLLSILKSYHSSFPINEEREQLSTQCAAYGTITVVLVFKTNIDNDADSKPIEKVDVSGVKFRNCGELEKSVMAWFDREIDFVSTKSMSLIRVPFTRDNQTLLCNLETFEDLNNLMSRVWFFNKTNLHPKEAHRLTTNASSHIKNPHNKNPYKVFIEPYDMSDVIPINATITIPIKPTRDCTIDIPNYTVRAKDPIDKAFLFAITSLNESDTEQLLDKIIKTSIDHGKCDVNWFVEKENFSFIEQISCGEEGILTKLSISDTDPVNPYPKLTDELRVDIDEAAGLCMKHVPLLAKVNEGDFTLTVEMQKLLLAYFILSSEVGEYGDVLKRHIMYGEPIDKLKEKEELGDIMYGLTLAIDTGGYKLSEIMESNQAKLKHRYPEGKFTLNNSNRKKRDDEKVRHIMSTSEE
jgi:NTP pyrophosphatase (non-canonical NTP hydrolase)